MGATLPSMEHTVRHDDAETLRLSLLQAFFKLRHVGIGVAVTLGFAQAHAVDNGSVVQRVGDDGVLFGEERLEHTAVGVKAGGVQNGVFRLEVIGNGGFQFFVNVLRSADETYGRHAVTAAFHYVSGGGYQAGMIG